MTKSISTAFIADVHYANFRRFGKITPTSLGTQNTRAEMIANAITAAGRYAVRQRCGRLVVLGDLFDRPHPSPSEVYFCDSALRQANIDVSILLGNHDRASDRYQDHSVASMGHHQPMGATTFELGALGSIYGAAGCAIAVPFSAKATEADVVSDLGRLCEHVASGVQGRFAIAQAVLMFHMGIRDSRTPMALRDAPDSIHVDNLLALMRKYGVRYAYAGNWHDHRMWSFPASGEPDGVARWIVQCGALCPTGFDNPGSEYGHVLIHTPGSAPAMAQVPGPRFISLPYEGETSHQIVRAVEDCIGKDCTVYIRLKAAPSKIAQAREVLRDLVAHRAIEDGEVVPDRVAIHERAMAAARAAKAATSIEAAVAAYVGRASMDAGVDRKRVLALVNGYLAGNKPAVSAQDDL